MIDLKSISLDELDALSRRDFFTFFVRVHTHLNPDVPLNSNWHIELMAAELQKFALGETTRLIINLPPRGLKSTMASVALTAWILGRQPSAHIISACYGQSLSEHFARATRKIMEAPWYCRAFPGTRLAQHQAHDLVTTKGGTRLATSVGGPLTGRGADFIIIDDPLKPDDALSDVNRQKANEWFDNTMSTRLNDKSRGAIAIVMQRLHQDDLVGHVLGASDNWTRITLPAIAEADEVHEFNTIWEKRRILRAEGTALHPARESVAQIEALRATMGDYNFSAQMQQRPIPLGGSIIKAVWLRYYRLGEQPAHFERIVQSWDTANKATELNDYSVCTTWGASSGHFYLLHVLRKRMEYPELRKTVIQHMHDHGAHEVIIEDKASGTQLLQDLEPDIGHRLRRYTPPTGMEKQMRMRAQTLAFENGRVHLPTEAPWLTEYVSELLGYPGTKFDDQIDSTAQALACMREPSAADQLMRAFAPGGNAERLMMMYEMQFR